MVNAVPSDTEALDTHRVRGHGANPEPDMHGASTGRQRELASAEKAAPTSPIGGERRANFTHLETTNRAGADRDRRPGGVHPQRDSVRREDERVDGSQRGARSA